MSLYYDSGSTFVVALIYHVTKLRSLFGDKHLACFKSVKTCTKDSFKKPCEELIVYYSDFVAFIYGDRGDERGSILFRVEFYDEHLLPLSFTFTESFSFSLCVSGSIRTTTKRQSKGGTQTLS